MNRGVTFNEREMNKDRNKMKNDSSVTSEESSKYFELESVEHAQEGIEVVLKLNKHMIYLKHQPSKLGDLTEFLI